MHIYAAALLVLVGAVVTTAKFTTPIEHVVVLMLENRAFDHMAGFFDGVDGLDLSMSNPVNTSNPTGDRIKVGNTSPFVAPLDPNHGTPATTSKIYGQACLDARCKTATMDGFAEYALRRHSRADAATLLNAFTPDRVPIMSTLASEFMIFDRFFAAHPGPTFPNRLFTMMGTSSGCTETTGCLFRKNGSLGIPIDGRTIFDMVEEAGHDWRFYYADAPVEMALVSKVLKSLSKVKPWKSFLSDVASGSLPFFSFVNPRWFVNLTTWAQSSDQHPDHDVRQVPSKAHCELAVHLSSP